MIKKALSKGSCFPHGAVTKKVKKRKTFLKGACKRVSKCKLFGFVVFPRTTQATTMSLSTIYLLLPTLSIYHSILHHPSRGRAPNYSGLFLFPKLIGTKNESKQPRILMLGPSVPIAGQRAIAPRRPQSLKELR